MKKITYLLLFAICIHAQKVMADYSNEKTKTITKSFNLSPSKIVAANNVYGKIEIVPHTGNKVEYVITIIAKANSESAAIDQINRVNVAFDDNNDRVSAITKLSKTGGSWWSKSTKLEINYIIKVPNQQQLDLSQDYGNIIIPNWAGKVNVSIDYGNLEGKNINNDVRVNVDYGKVNLGNCKNIIADLDYTNMTLEGTNQADINMDYGDIKINSAKTININADYVNCTFGNVDYLKADSDYTSYKINQVEEMYYDNDYGNLKIDKLNGSLTASGDYQHISIRSLEGIDGCITLNGDYSSLKINSQNGFNYKVVGSYTSVNTNSLGADNNQSGKGVKSGSKSGKKTYDITLNGDYSNLSGLK